MGQLLQRGIGELLCLICVGVSDQHSRGCCCPLTGGLADCHHFSEPIGLELRSSLRGAHDSDVVTASAICPLEGPDLFSHKSRSDPKRTEHVTIHHGEGHLRVSGGLCSVTIRAVPTF